MKILVNKCPDTGKLFEDDEEYKKYRRQLLREKRAAERYETEKAEALQWITDEKLKISKVEQIPVWVLEHQAKLMEIYNKYGPAYYEGKFVKEDIFTKFEFRNVRFNYLVSNTHSCPHNGVTNWHCNNDKPRGYIGWQGRIEGALSRPHSKRSTYPYTGFCKFLGIHTGTGGGGNSSWGFDIKIFLADWPGLQQEYTDIVFEEEVKRYENEQNRILARLKGNRWA